MTILSYIERVKVLNKAYIVHDIVWSGKIKHTDEHKLYYMVKINSNNEYIKNSTVA